MWHRKEEKEKKKQNKRRGTPIYIQPTFADVENGSLEGIAGGVERFVFTGHCFKFADFVLFERRQEDTRKVLWGAGATS